MAGIAILMAALVVAGMFALNATLESALAPPGVSQLPSGPNAPAARLQVIAAPTQVPAHHPAPAVATLPPPTPPAAAAGLASASAPLAIPLVAPAPSPVLATVTALAPARVTPIASPAVVTPTPLPTPAVLPPPTKGHNGQKHGGPGGDRDADPGHGGNSGN